MLPKWIRSQLYEFIPMKWNIEYDNLSNNFEPIVKEIDERYGAQIKELDDKINECKNN